MLEETSRLSPERGSAMGWKVPVSLVVLLVSFSLSAHAVKTSYCEFFCTDGDGRLLMWKQRSLIHDGTASDRALQIKNSIEDFCGKLTPRAVCKDQEPKNPRAELEKALCAPVGAPGIPTRTQPAPDPGTR